MSALYDFTPSSFEDLRRAEIATSAAIDLDNISRGRLGMLEDRIDPLFPGLKRNFLQLPQQIRLI